jgi:hypothetical protein
MRISKRQQRAISRRIFRGIRNLKGWYSDFFPGVTDPEEFQRLLDKMTKEDERLLRSSGWRIKKDRDEMGVHVSGVSPTVSRIQRYKNRDSWQVEFKNGRGMLIPGARPPTPQKADELHQKKFGTTGAASQARKDRERQIKSSGWKASALGGKSVNINVWERFEGNYRIFGEIFYDSKESANIREVEYGLSEKRLIGKIKIRKLVKPREAFKLLSNKFLR